MDLDELVTAIRQTSSDPVASDLAALLSAWKDDDRDAKELETMVERFIGNARIDGKTEYKTIPDPAGGNGVGRLLPRDQLALGLAGGA